MAHTTEHKLWVVESNGGPRSGKGTITAALADSFPGAAQDETGADYRAITHGLLYDNIIEVEMDEKAVKGIVEGLEPDEIAGYAAQRYEIIAEQGDAILYSEAVNAKVGSVSPHEVVRQAVKKGFSRRVQRQVDNPNTHFLFVDGRNLRPVIETVEGADILLRMFVDCQPYAAGKREAARANKDLTDPANDEWFRKTVSDIRRRQLQDQKRPVDAAIEDSNSINYWFNNALHTETAERYACVMRVPFAEASGMLTSGDDQISKGGRHGAGAKAVVENRQVYFDTTQIGKESMTALARRMVEEALNQNSGLYNPTSEALFEQKAV